MAKKKKTAAKTHGSRIFLVKHIADPENGNVLHVGPFHDEEEAMNTCVYFLKRGTCSWLVEHNG